MPAFEALYGYPPSIPTAIQNTNSLIEAVAYAMKTQDEINQLLQVNLVKAQQHMKFYVDLKRIDKQYKVGDWVYLKIQPYRHTTLSNTHFHKLVARYYGPYKVLEMIGNVAYNMELPTNLKFIIFSMFPYSNHHKEINQYLQLYLLLIVMVILFHNHWQFWLVE